MQIQQSYWGDGRGWHPQLSSQPGNAQLVFVFGGTAQLHNADALGELRSAYPNAIILGCSTAGEIYDTQVLDDTLVATAVQFAHTHVIGAHAPLANAADSYAAGRALAGQFDPNGLVHVFVLSEGLSVNGSELVDGLAAHLPAHISITGGLSADGPRFAKTLVHWNGETAPSQVVAIGLYGERLRVGYGSLGGWDAFGPDRLVTRSCGNVLYELDGTSALALYKRYLGEHANDLPSSGLLFPLSISSGPAKERVVRTILAVDEAAGSITFAGDVPEGAYAQLMKANFDRLIDGAQGAASSSLSALGVAPAELALLISCVGRKLVLKQRIEEEVEAVRDVLGDAAVLAGFYSYGEISPLLASTRCALHNQTMTITTFAEV